jgi:hypothetical protein
MRGHGPRRPGRTLEERILPDTRLSHESNCGQQRPNMWDVDPRRLQHVAVPRRRIRFVRHPHTGRIRRVPIDAPMCCQVASDVAGRPVMCHSVRASSYQAMRCRVVMGWVGGRRIDRKTTMSASGSHWVRRQPRTCLGARQQPVGLAGDVAFQHAHDLSFREALFGAPLDVGAGAGVVAHAGEHDPPQRMVRLTVPG